jgi:hypothetical protein
MLQTGDINVENIRAGGEIQHMRVNLSVIHTNVTAEPLCNTIKSTRKVRE